MRAGSTRCEPGGGARRWGRSRRWTRIGIIAGRALSGGGPARILFAGATHRVTRDYPVPEQCSGNGPSGGARQQGLKERLRAVLRPAAGRPLALGTAIAIVAIPALIVLESTGPEDDADDTPGEGAQAVCAPGPQASSDITPRPDIPPQSGGRSGSDVKDLTGPPSSAIRGSPGRICITDSDGNVVLDVTADRAKPVTPGEGFGDKRAPTPDELDLLNELWPRPTQREYPSLTCWPCIGRLFWHSYRSPNAFT